MQTEYTTADERERARTWRGWERLAPFFLEYLARLDTHLEAALGALRAQGYPCSCYRMAEVSTAEWATRQPCGPACTVLEEKPS